jgi:UDP-N-acetylglucosamine 3-dehydrogenase
VNDTPPANLIPRDTDRIELAVVGMGQMGLYHLRAVEQLLGGLYEPYYKADAQQELKKLRLVGLCDRDADRLEPLADTAATFVDLARLLAEARPDLVVLCTPTASHVELTRQILSAGVHVLVEKPIATRRQDVRDLMALADEQGVRLMSGHVERYNPVAIKIAALLHDERFPAERYRFRRIQRHDPRIPDDILTDKLIHDLDLAMYFFGPIEQARLLDHHRQAGRIVQALVELTHRDGSAGQIEVSWLTGGDEKIRHLELTGPSGRLDGDLVAKTLARDGEPLDTTVPGWCEPSNNQIKDELVDFILWCCQPPHDDRRIPPLLSPAEIVEGVDWLERIAEQADAT